jgi:competence protein ComEC
MKTRILLSVILVALAALCVITYNAPVIRLHFINIGEGDAVLIQSRWGHCLIDSGGPLSALKLSRYLKSRNVKGIKHLIITHPDLDHYLGAFSILQEFVVENVYDNGYPLNLEKDDIQRWYNQAIRLKPGYRGLKQGDIIALGQARMDVLWPKAGYQPAYPNAGSVVLSLSYKGFSCLFAGDLPAFEQEEIARSSSSIKSYVLKFPHHGNQDALSGAFLDKALPRLAIISVCAQCRKGLPSEAVLKALSARRIEVLRTDKDGDIVVNVYRDGSCRVRR